jgi:uncharacterized membrane protein YgcG
VTNFRLFIGILCVLFCLSCGAALAQSNIDLSYLIDGQGKRLGATVETGNGTSRLGELFVDARGNVGFIDCGRARIDFDLVKVSRAKANCTMQPAQWTAGLYSQLRSNNAKVELPDGLLGALPTKPRLPLPPTGCSAGDCDLAAGLPCVICEPVDPDDPWWCLVSPACMPAQPDQWILPVEDFAPEKVELVPEMANAPDLSFMLNGEFYRATLNPEGTTNFDTVPVPFDARPEVPPSETGDPIGNNGPMLDGGGNSGGGFSSGGGFGSGGGSGGAGAF